MFLSGNLIVPKEHDSPWAGRMAGLSFTGKVPMKSCHAAASLGMARNPRLVLS